MVDAVLCRATQETDVAVTYNADMKVSEQCGIAVLKCNQTTITYKEKQPIVPLFQATVTLHLEYFIYAWRSYRKKDRYKLEIVHRRTTTLVTKLRDISNESRLLECGLTTLETRRLRGDQIEVLKIDICYEDIDRNLYFKLNYACRTRGH